MKLISLALKNFKGIKSFLLDTGGNNADIYGDNATGKTTLFDAFTWLLFDKDSQNKKDFDIKTLDENGQVLSGLDHEVEAALEIEGRTVILRKVYAEQWTKKRGSIEREFTGHTTSYFIDGVPVKKNEYAAKIAEIAGEEAFKLLTNPSYFNTQLHWQDRRKTLLQVCGDISDGDVIASDKSLAKLPDILGNRKLEEHKKVIAARRAEINKEIEKIPIRIDEIQHGLPDIAGLDMAALAIERGQLVKLSEAKQAEISRIKNGGEVAEKTKQLREIESELLDIKYKHRLDLAEQVDGKRQELIKLQSSLGARESQLKTTERALKNNEEAVKDYEAEAEKLRQQWHEANSKEFTFEQDDSCPACGQALPASQLGEAKEKALASFNRQKAGLLEEVSAKGKKRKADIETLKVEIEENKADIESIKIDIYSAQSLVNELQEQINAITASASDPTESPEYKKAIASKQKLESEISELQTGSRELLTATHGEEQDIKEQIQVIDTDMMKIKQHEQSKTRMNELKAQEKKLAAEFEKLEYELNLAEQFIRAKVALLESKINSRFKMARFKLFDVQVNGGVVECCDTVYNGVPYNSLNNAARINIGLDIINTLAEFYQFDAPIFIDNAEAVTNLLETQGQQIRLVVSGKDKQLRVAGIESFENTLFGEAV